MRLFNLTVSCLVLTMLAACGSKDAGPAAGDGGSGATASSAPTGAASAEKVAKESRGKVNCPAKVSTPATAGGPVIDVVGLRPGITYEEAKNIVLCDNPLMIIEAEATRGFNIQTYGQTVRQGFAARFAEERIEKSSKQIMQEMQDDAIARSGNAVRDDMKPGQVKFYVGTIGLPGQEKVIYATREERFVEGKAPPVESVVTALTAKYGPVTMHKNNPTQQFIRWIYDLNGRPVTETSPLYNSCAGVADPDGGANFSPDCGLVVEAQVWSTTDNPAIARNLQVGVIDQANGYAALNATEDGLRKQDEERKAKELKDATKNAAAPKL